MSGLLIAWLYMLTGVAVGWIVARWDRGAWTPPIESGLVFIGAGLLWPVVAAAWLIGQLIARTDT